VVSPPGGLKTCLKVRCRAPHLGALGLSAAAARSTPARAMCEEAARQMGVTLPEMFHTGDRDHTDVKGPKKLGMRAILFTATRPADRAHTSADAICDRHADLPAIVDRLAG